jgi:autotransporter-associated beta strand protein
MKPTCNPFLRSFRPAPFAISVVISVAALLPSARAGSRTKGANGTDLTNAASWDALPAAADIATWDSGSLGAGLTLNGGAPNWLGIRVNAEASDPIAIGSGGTLTLGTGGIDMSAAAVDLTLSSELTIGAGNQVWSLASGRVLTLNTGAFNRSAGATLNIKGAGTVAASMTGLTNEGTTGILGPWATVGTGSATTYATLSGSHIVSFTSGTNVSGASLANPGDANVNYNITTASTTTYGAANRTGNTFRLAAGATTLTFGNGAGQINLITNGIMNAGTGLLTLTSGGSNASSGIMIGANNGRELVVNAANNNISLGRIINNTGGASSVTIIGPNTVTLTGANTYTGGTHLSNGATVAFGNQTFSTNISGSGAILNNVAGSAAIFTGDHSGFSGTVTQNSSGNTQFNSSTSGSANAAYSIAAGEIIFAGPGNYTVQLGSLSSTAGTIRGGNAAAGTTTLEVGNLGTDTSIGGGLSNGSSKIIALTKVGTGTVTLSGAKTYTGATTVNGGTLALAATGSIANSSGLALNGGNFNVSAVSGGYALGSTQTLTGSGYVTGDLIVNGTLTIGSSPGTIVFNDNLGLGVNSVSNFEFIDGSFALNSFDLASSGAGTQNVSFGGTLNLFFNGAETFADNSSVKIFDFEGYSGNFTDLTFSGLGTGQSAQFDSLTGVVTVIPEPSLAMLMGSVGLFFLYSRRRSG